MLGACMQKWNSPCVSDLGFLHGVEIELLGQSERIESEIAGVCSIEGGGTGKEGNGDGVGLVVVSSAVFVGREERRYGWFDLV